MDALLFLVTEIKTPHGILYKIYTMALVMFIVGVYPHRASLKNMPGHGGNRTYDLWNTSPMSGRFEYVIFRTPWLSVLEQLAEFDLLFVLQS